MSDERKVVLVLLSIFFVVMILKPYKPESDHQLIEQFRLDTKEVIAQSPDDIVPIDSSLVEPVLYSNIYFLDSLPSDEAKQKFIDVMMPAILIVKWQLEKELERLDQIIQDGILDQGDSMLVANWFDQYKTDNLPTLRRRLLTHPNSIVLAQAAVESGWGKSRFFIEANNVFGVWSYNSDEPRIPASIRREDYQVYLRKYGHIAESVMDYFKTIARAPAYTGFRRKRAETSDIRELLPYLDKYSERGQEYVTQLMTMIRYNDLQRYDNYQIDPAYVVMD
ncbi:glucosaminidase domain-containing protein [Roseivirga sp.]|uniref:glucosaminidase domain-containing protein n=1 Tax=Roseivirga sp. TaxID=1964215 RepID=UPI003B52DF3D